MNKLSGQPNRTEISLNSTALSGIVELLGWAKENSTLPWSKISE